MHFTYAPTPDKLQLKQGDVIKKTDEVNALLKQFYPYWAASADYTHLMVVSQTCDLVRRDGPCKSPYISVAAVKPLATVLQLRVSLYQRKEFERCGNVCSIDKRDDFIRFLERLKNNNEGDYFYLHQQPECDFPADSCSFLRVSATLHAAHYDSLLGGKILELVESFQAKLGWLVGTIYSRVGTEDWITRLCNRKTFNQLLRVIADETCHWLESPNIGRLENEWERAGQVPEQAEKAVIEQLKGRKQLKRRQRVVESVIQVLSDKAIIQPDQVVNLRRALYELDDIRNLQ